MTYELWNQVVANTCLFADSPDGVVQLTITPHTLARACEQAELELFTPEEAEDCFVASVSAVYVSRILRRGQGLLALRSPTEQDIPYATGFLALSVLAAYHMHTDGDYTAAAFYPRLAQMLGCELHGSLPVGFDRDDYVVLWVLLGEWLRTHFGRRLAMPDAATNARRYLAYPLAHVPLREVDINRLPQFFEAHGYEAGTRPSHERLASDLVGRDGPWRYLTEAGRSALRDARRRRFVVRQVAQELEQWDGSTTDAAGNRTASIELWMDIRRQVPELQLLARRPSGFPEQLSNGEHVFEAGHDGWYEAIPLGQADGRVLSEGMRVGTGQAQGRFHLQLRSYRAVPLTPSPEFSGFVSDHALRADTRCVVLCTEDVADTVARYLETISGEQVRMRRDGTLPTGWCLFTGVRPVTVTAPPVGLEKLAVESEVGLVCEGGLTLGRRWTWLEDAPPLVRVIGSRTGLVAKIDGQVVELDEAGCLPNGPLAALGEHVVEIGNRIRRKAVVVPAKIHLDCQPWHQGEENRMPVALPEGRWFVAGSKEGELLPASIPPGGATVRPHFQASWAIQVGAGPGATAIHIHDESEGMRQTVRTGKSSPLRKPTGRGSSSADGASIAWTETIYQANVRRPVLSCSYGCSKERVTEAWHETAKMARNSKRRLRR